MSDTPWELILQQAMNTEFDVEQDDFAALEIRQDGERNFFYFYDTVGRGLVKGFVLKRAPRVETICDVILIEKDGRFTPRLTFWKKDTTKRKFKAVDLNEDLRVEDGHMLLIKARVDLSDCHDNLWRLLDFLSTHRDIDVPSGGFRVAESADAELLEAFQGHDKTAVLSAVKAHLGSELTEADVQMLVDRRSTLAHFEKLLVDPNFFDSEMKRLDKQPEGLWQAFFEENTWIFGYGLTLVACETLVEGRLEQITTGRNVFTGAGKRIDALMRTRGFLQSLLFAEIKRHDKPLLMTTPYRPPDVYQVTSDLNGAVAQVQKTTHKAIRDLHDLERIHSPEGAFMFDAATVHPRQIVVAGNLADLSDDGAINVEKMTSFELWRHTQAGVEIITYDELLERARFIARAEG